MLVCREIIEAMGKTTVLAKYAKYIRRWYIFNELPASMIEDKDIIPYFTPCGGHRRNHEDTEDVFDEDEIDGVLIMMAYCPMCTKMNSSASSYSKPLTPCLTYLPTHPLKMDWSKEEEEEDKEMEIITNSENNFLSADRPPTSSYSPTLFC